MNQADIAVIGGGPGGYAAAVRAAQAGAAVVLVEKEAPGGTCLNRGCIPTKALVTAVNELRSAQSALRRGTLTGEIRPNFGRMMAEKNQAVENLRQGLLTLLKKNKVQLVNAAASVRKPGEVQLSLPTGAEEFLAARNIILATGSAGVRPLVEGIDLPGVMDSEGILSLETLPDKLLIIGGGVIGLEFAGVFSGLGCRVAVVEMLPAVLPMMDADMSRRLLSLLKRNGVEVYLQSKLRAVRQAGPKLAVTLERGKTGDTVTIGGIDAVLVAVGRAPTLPGVDPEALGLKMSGRAVSVNEKMETNIPGVYAVGDCTGGLMLAHTATAQGVAAAENALGGDRRVDLHTVPACVFTHPEMAAVGLGEDEAKHRGRNVRVGRFPYAALGKAVTLGETAGWIKLIADRETGVLLGGQILGHAATELIAEVALAVRNSLTAADVAETIHAHPTLAEGVMEAAHAIVGKPLHVFT